jgi:hypothetical protein
VERGERQAVLDDATYRSWAGDLDGVVTRLRGWLAAHPDDRDARLRLARVRAWQSRWGEARAEYERILARAPADGEATLGLAQLDLWADRPESARARIEALPSAARELPELRLLEARLAVAEGRPAAARARLGSLLHGPSGREAEQLMDELVAGHGLWTRLGGTVTRSNEGLVQKTPALSLRAPLGQGHADVEAGWSEVSLGGETRGAAVTSLLVSQPFGARVSADAGLGFRDRFAGARGLSARGGVTVLVLPALALRLDAGRSLLDFTPTAVDRADAITTLEGGLTWTFGEGSRTLAAGGGYGLLDAGTQRGSFIVSAEQRADWWRHRFPAREPQGQAQGVLLVAARVLG